MKATISLVIFFVLALSFTACRGPAGPMGAPGLDGSENVFSYFYEVFEEDWVEFGTYGTIGYGWQIALDFPEIDDDILNDGAVLVYIYQKGSYYALPATFYYEDGSSSSYWTALSLGEVTIAVQDDNGITLNPGDMEFKVVIIEGVDFTLKNLNLSSFEELQGFFSTKE